MSYSITPQKNYVRQTNYFSQKKLHAILILFLFIFSSAWADDIITINANDQTITKRTTWTDCTVNISGNGTITYSERITINGTVHLNIEAGSTLKANRGISVIEGNSLTIDGEGSIIATTKSGDYGSALGGADANGSRNAGSITILGGNISATSQNRAAGIGGANKGNGGNITISGGTVYAKAAYHAAGIGGGCNGNAETITISGGVVNAIGDGYGAGIGGGDSDSGISGDGGNIVISGGQVTATGGSGGSKGPGYGIGPGGPRYNAGSGAEGSIFLSWENESDFIDASSYVGAISFAENKRFYYDGSTDYATTEGLYKQSKKIVPAVANNNSLTFAEIQMRRYYTTTIGTAININYDVYDYNGNKLTLGNDYTAIIKNSNNEEITTFDQLDDYTLTIIGKGSYSDSKSFTFSLVQQDPNLIQDGNEYYINFPNTGKKAVSLAANETIKVYDSEGKNGNYIASDGFLMLYAPEGYAFEVTGKIDAVSHDAIKGIYFNTLNAYEGNDETTLITSIDRNSDNILFFSNGNEMLMHFQCPWPGSGHGLDLTVKVVQATSHTISVESSANGSIESDKMSANANEKIQLIVSTAKGYLLKNISITDSDNGSTISTIGEDFWYTDGNIVTFQMPGKNITLTPEFTNDLTAANGLTLKIDPLRISEYTIPDSVISFNISGSANTGSFTTAILKSQAGYRLRAGGLIKFFNYSNRELAEISIYDGPTTSSTLLTNINGNNYKETAIVDIGTQTTTSNYITIYLKENELNAEFTGTIEVVYNISYELAGGSVAIDNIDDYTHETETFTLTNPTRDGYEFAGWIGTGLEKASTEVTIAKGSSGNRSYTATWIKPLTHSDITIVIPSQTYTGTAIEPEVTATDGETTLTLGSDYTVSYSANTNAGSTTVTITGMGNYSGSVEKEFTIAKAPLKVTAKNKTIVYGDEPANDGVEYSGFVGSDDASVLGGTLAFNTDYKQYGNVGTYAITPSGLTADNYDISFASGTLTVEPKKTDFAAVQILEDENGARAIIDGEYTADNAAVNIPENIEVASVDFTRSFTPDVFATVTFPFEVNTSCLTGIDSIIEFQGITADYEVDFGVIWKKTETGEQTHITLQPYHPYMISMNSATLGINCQDQEHTSLTLKATSEEVAEDIVQRYGNWIFTGTLAYKQWQAGDPDLIPTRVVYGYAAEADGKYGVGAFVRIGTDASISPFRAYIKYSPLPQMSNKPAPAPAGVMMANSAVSGNATASIDNLPESMDVVITSKDENGNEHTTVIGSINTRTGEIRFNRRTADRWFDMQGCVLQGKPTVKGRYLHNGKVEIVK